MNEIVLRNSIVTELKKTRENALESSLKRWSVTLFFSAILGGFCGVAGVTLGTMSLFGLLRTHQRVDHIGIALLCSAFPLLILAAHCIDKAHDVEKAITIEYCKRTGMNNDDLDPKK